MSTTFHQFCLFSAFVFGMASAVAETTLPFAAEVAIEEFESYQADIAKKAAAAIDKKRTEVVAKLKAEAAKQSKSGNAAVAADILKVVEKMEADAAAEKEAAALAARRWVPLFEDDELPGRWQMPAEPDGGWSHKGGELQLQSLLKYALVLYEVPAGDLVVRGKMKLDPNGKGEKEQQAGIGFLGGEDNMLAAIAQAPGVILAFGKIPGAAPITEIDKNGACQSRFGEVQIAWVGKRFKVFVRGKLVHDCEVKTSRQNGNIALLANNAKAHFRDVEMRVPDSKDLARLAEGKSLD